MTTSPEPLPSPRATVMNAMPSTGRILLLGPRAAQLAEAFDGADVVALPLVEGPLLTQLLGDGSYDACLLLDGPETALTPDDEPLAHKDLLALAAGFVRPHGTLIALVGNEATQPLLKRPRHDANADWWVGQPGYDTRRPWPSEAPGLLERAQICAVLPHLRPAEVDAVRRAPHDTVQVLASGWLLVRNPMGDVPDAVAQDEDTPWFTTPPETAIDADLRALMADKDEQLTWLERRYAEQERRVRALEMAVATSEGPWPRRALFILTAPVHRVVDAVRVRRLP